MKSAVFLSSVRLQKEAKPCEQCGTTARIGHSLCLKCLLEQGLGPDTYNGETLEEVLHDVGPRALAWQVANYQILEEIGRGGMGVIYRARQRHSLRIVAVKRMLEYQADSRETAARFRREAEAAASLDHPNIVPIYEVGESEDGLPFFSMKFAAGGSLLDNEAAFLKEPRESVLLMIKICRAIQYAHERRILHRDLKPGNILLDGRGEPMVSDFGLAKWLDASSDLTRTLTVFGTPGYIAPEQTNGSTANIGASADVYSLGAILFDLFAGRPPFLGEHAFAVIQQATEKPAPKLRSLAPAVDRDLERICSRCLDREPRARYQSAGDLADDLKRWFEGRPVVARPVPPAVRVWRWTRRNPKLATALGGSILGGVAALILAALTFFPAKSPLRSSLPMAEKGVAVLPFENLSDSKQQDFFAVGIQDEILNDLAKVADLKVISRTSVMQYGSGTARNLREIARQLGVAHILEGTVQRTGDRVRVSAQLIDARTDTHLWGDRFDRQVKDVFAIESELAEQIVTKLKAKLSPAEKAAIEQPPTSDLVAYEIYLKAKDLIQTYSFSASGNENLLKATQLLDQAIARDPNFLSAYIELAGAHDQIYSFGVDHTSGRLALADQAIQAIRRLSPNSGQTHLVQAQHFYFGYRDYYHARAEITLALRDLPNDSAALLLAGLIDRRQGRWEDAIRKMQRALELDPRNLDTIQQLTQSYAKVRRYSDMLAMIDRALVIVPHDPSTRVYRAEVLYRWRADLGPMRSEIQAIVLNDPKSVESISENWFELALDDRNPAWAEQAVAALPADGYHHEAFRYPRAWCEGLVARLRGDEKAARTAFAAARAEVEEIVRQQPNYPEALSVLGMIDAALGRKEDAIREGQQAVALLPATKDAINAPLCLNNLSIIYAWTGEKRLALNELAEANKLPGGFSYGHLQFHPLWDPLRGDRRFEKLVATLGASGK